jgi:hypothetical protein
MSTKKASINPSSLLKKTRKAFKSVLGFKPKLKLKGSPEMKHHEIFSVPDYKLTKTAALKQPNTTDEVFEKTREKAFGVAMNYPRIKESLLQKKPAELTKIYVKYNDIYPKVLDFIQTETDKHNVEIGPSESNVKRAEKIAIAIALKSKSDIKKSLHSSTRRNKPKHNISHKASASKPASKSATPKETMEQLMKSIYSKPVEEKKVELTTDDLVSMIHKAQVELREQELALMRKSKK